MPNVKQFFLGGGKGKGKEKGEGFRYTCSRSKFLHTLPPLGSAHSAPILYMRANGRNPENLTLTVIVKKGSRSKKKKKNAVFCASYGKNGSNIK